MIFFSHEKIDVIFVHSILKASVLSAVGAVRYGVIWHWLVQCRAAVSVCSCGRRQSSQQHWLSDASDPLHRRHHAVTTQEGTDTSRASRQDMAAAPPAAPGAASRPLIPMNNTEEKLRSINILAVVRKHFRGLPWNASRMSRNGYAKLSEDKLERCSFQS